MNVCPFCDSTRLRKRGLSRSGHKRYTCNDCKKTSTGNDTGRPHNLVTQCPRCKGITKKNGRRNIYQKYLCINEVCKYAFEEFI